MAGNTRERIKAAALPLFAELGFAGTSIGAIEKGAGLAPRAGAFYRHFASKEALFLELAEALLTEHPDEFDFDGLALLDDTRAELTMIARQYEVASRRQSPYLRVIEELRGTEAGRTFEARANQEMFDALCAWVAAKPGAKGRSESEVAALTMSVFGSWLFFTTKQQQGIEFEMLSLETYIKTWAAFWSPMLDETSGAKGD